MSAKEIGSNLLVTTALPEKFYGEMVCTWIRTVHIYWLVICILNKSIWQTEDNNTTVGKDSCKQSFDSFNEVKHNNSIDYINNVISHEQVTGKDSDCLCNLRLKNVNRLIIGNLNKLNIK